MIHTPMTVVLAAGLAAAVPAPSGLPHPDEAPLSLAGGCHSSIRTHYVPEAGREMRHRHRADCSPVVTGGGDRRNRREADCHRDVRTHRIGGRLVTHRHVGKNCVVREVRGSTTIVPE